MRKPLFSSLLLFACAVPVFAQSSSVADAHKDPVLKAMLEELDRSKQQLQLQDFQKPYFIEYRIDDVAEYEATASYGSLLSEHDVHRRVVRVTVRVGDYKLDNSSERGEGSLQIATLDDDLMALRYALWSATDSAYKTALNSYTEKQAALKAVQTPPQADDFSQEKPVVSLAPVLHEDLDHAVWKQRLVEGTGLYRTDPSVKTFAQEIQTSDGSVRSHSRTEYLVNSEGTIVRKSTVGYRAEVSARAQAADGMRLERSYGVSGLMPADLGSAEKFHNGVLRILTGLHDLRNAPVMSDEYHGPVIFTGNASAHAFEDLFARAVTARRPQLGSTARTVGPFASSYKTRVLPDFMMVVDDPGLTEFDGHPVLGAYKIDDEGVPAQSVTLVDNGKLMNYLTGREPIRDFPGSNGHARATTAQIARPQIGVFHVEASAGLSEDELKQKLLTMGKDQGLDFVYLIEAIGSISAPRTVYRIKVADGTRELVRGAHLDDVDLRLFRSGILAASKDDYVFNTSGEVPSTIIAPSLLFDDITVKRAEQRNDKLPYYPPPE